MGTALKKTKSGLKNSRCCVKVCRKLQKKYELSFRKYQAYCFNDDKPRLEDARFSTDNIDRYALFLLTCNSRKNLM